VKVSVIGLGKLGLPVALAMDLKGHDVMGYDVDASKMRLDYPHVERGPNGEPSIVPLLKASGLRFGTLKQAVAHGELIFVVVQTPHAPRYEGITRLPEERRDFDYSYLKRSVVDIAKYAESDKVLSIISTCTPGTIDREIGPLLPGNLHLAHTPFFEAMGQVVSDFLHREFVLIGTEDARAERKLREFFATITDAPQVVTSIADAEAVKVYYNTFITCKIVFANTVMEACEKYGASLLPKFILGTAYKAGVAHEIGSTALLCKNILEEWGHTVETWDPYVDGGECPLTEPRAVLVGVNHPEFAGFEFPEGCHVVDPWGITGRGVGRAGS